MLSETEFKVNHPAGSSIIHGNKNPTAANQMNGKTIKELRVGDIAQFEKSG
jgi:hypothetical protein